MQDQVVAIITAERTLATCYNFCLLSADRVFTEARIP
jgi:hypothetical protein